MVKGVKRTISVILIGTFLLLCAASALAVQSDGHIVLLAVYHEGDKFSGSPADLQLQIKPGNGRVFLETIPLSKVDTQISTRFAKQIACDFAEADCSQYDFFYTIKSAAGIVGGPSAGSAIAALTAIMLMDLDLDSKVTVTGTINSGELVGPVGSLKQKIDAAKEAGMTKVLIPAVQQELEEDNTTSLEDYGKEVGVKVIPVNTLSEVMTEFTGKEFIEPEREIETPESYKKTMKEVSEKLCTRAEGMIEQASVFDLNRNKETVLDNVKDIQEAKNLTRKAEEAGNEGKYYSKASFCFAANVKARRVLYEKQDLDKSAMHDEMMRLQTRLNQFDSELEGKEKRTLTDLQTYMIVKERVLESKQVLETGENNSQKLAYSEERLYSGEAWSEFFGTGAKNFDFNDEILKTTCENNIKEVEERFQYLNLFFPGLLNDLRLNLNTAHEYYKTGEYGLCIFIASRTKADANILVTLLGVKEESLGMVLEQKMKAARRAINRQIDKGTFPILAYSYYQYASSLKDNQISALLYSEYALELSDLTVYLEEGKTNGKGKITIPFWKVAPVLLFLWGLILGYLYSYIKHREKKEKTERNVKKRKKIDKKGKKIKKNMKKTENKKMKTTRTGIRLR